MRLIVKYNWYTISTMIVVFILSIIGAFFLIKGALTRELDLSMLRVKTRIQRYVDENQKLPVINSLDDEKIGFRKTSRSLNAEKFETVEQYISEQHKYHISRRLSYGIILGNQPYVVSISCPLEGTRHMITAMFEITIITIALLILIILALNRGLMKKLWAPFYQAVNQLNGFSISDTNQLQLPETDIIEFKFLIDNIRQTTSNATEGYRILKEFTENASHEIQTPLAIISSQLDLLVQDQGLNGTQSEHLVIAYQALKRLSKLNQSLLLIAKIDNQQFNRISRIDLKDKVTHKIKEFNELWLSKKIDVRFDLSDAYIEANPELIDIMLNNLFSNSCKHNYLAGAANIELKSGTLTVINTGKMESLDTTQIFNRFYKEETDASSSGLGLSIVKRICEQSGIQPHYNFCVDTNEHQFLLEW